MGFDELHAQSGPHRSATLLVRFADAMGEGGHAALFEILIHEGIHDRIVEAVEEPDGLNNGDYHVKCDSVIFLLQVIWKITHREKSQLKQRLYINGNMHLIYTTVQRFGITCF